MQASLILEFIKTLPMKWIFIIIVALGLFIWGSITVFYNSQSKSMEALPDVKETITSDKSHYNNLIRPDSGKLQKQPNRSGNQPSKPYLHWIF